MNMRVWYLNLILCFCTFTFNVNFYLGWQNSRRACRLIATSRRIDRLYGLPYFSISSFSARYSARDRKAEYYDERVCVRVCVCLSVCPRSYLRNCTSDLHQNFCACYPWLWLGPPSSGGVVIRYVLPVLWMTSYLHISQGCSTLPPPSWSAVYTQPWAWL